MSAPAREAATGAEDAARYHRHLCMASGSMTQPGHGQIGEKACGAGDFHDFAEQDERQHQRNDETQD
jgi:hypothetical protein